MSTRTLPSVGTRGATSALSGPTPPPRCVSGPRGRWRARCCTPPTALTDRRPWGPVPSQPDELSFAEGDVVGVVREESGGWWLGLVGEQLGWYPSKYCEEIPEGEDGSEGGATVLDDASTAAGADAEAEDSGSNEAGGAVAAEETVSRTTLDSTGESSGLEIIMVEGGEGVSADALRSALGAVSGGGAAAPSTAVASAAVAMAASVAPAASAAAVASPAPTVTPTVAPDGAATAATAEDARGDGRRVQRIDSGVAVGSAERWFDGLPSAVVDAMSDTQKRRQEAAFECLTSERAYLHDLRVMISVFLEPMRQHRALDKADLAVLFSNIEQVRIRPVRPARLRHRVLIRARADTASWGWAMLACACRMQLVPLSEELVHCLEERRAKSQVIERVGDLYLLMADFFKMYTLYCSNYEYALALLEKELAGNKGFRTFLAECEKHKECRLLNLQSFLIKPVQRVCKYPLLLGAVLKHTPEAHVDYSPLRAAIAKIEAVVTMVNEGSRAAEAVKRMLEIQNRIRGFELNGQPFQLITPSRRLLREDAALEMVAPGKFEERSALLFNDMILILRMTGKLTALLLFTECIVNGDLPQYGQEEEVLMFEVIHIGRSKVTLKVKKPEVKQIWVDEIVEGTREHLERQQEEWLARSTSPTLSDEAVPATGSPSPSPTASPNTERKRRRLFQRSTSSVATGKGDSDPGVTDAQASGHEAEPNPATDAAEPAAADKAEAKRRDQELRRSRKEAQKRAAEERRASKRADKAAKRAQMAAAQQAKKEEREAQLAAKRAETQSQQQAAAQVVAVAKEQARHDAKVESEAKRAARAEAKRAKAAEKAQRRQQKLERDERAKREAEAAAATAVAAVAAAPQPASAVPTRQDGQGIAQPTEKIASGPAAAVAATAATSTADRSPAPRAFTPMSNLRRIAQPTGGSGEVGSPYPQSFLRPASDAASSGAGGGSSGYRRTGSAVGPATRATPPAATGASTGGFALPSAYVRTQQRDKSSPVRVTSFEKHNGAYVRRAAGVGRSCPGSTALIRARVRVDIRTDSAQAGRLTCHAAPLVYGVLQFAPGADYDVSERSRHRS